jgi:peroxiredoxin Q/BCP
MAEAYGVWVQKSMYGRTYRGMERSSFLVGADGKIVRV